VVQIPTGKITKTNKIIKALNTFLLEYRFLNTVKTDKDEKYDLVIYSTPPITFEKIIRFLKKRDHCSTYLLLKDIFPQNAVDLGLIKKDSIIYKKLRKKEKIMYAISDRIGCMSPANVQYLLTHNPEIPPFKVHVNPNSIYPTNIYLTNEKRAELLEEYEIPENSLKMIYGGNLGKPQGIDFVLKILKALSIDDQVFILIIGDGTEFNKLHSFIKVENIKNAKLLRSLPQEKYFSILRCMVVGLIFLDHRFTIPNVPSRILDYLDASLPVLLATDTNTDIGKIIQDSGAGLWSESADVSAFLANVNIIKDIEIRAKASVASNNLLRSFFYVEKSADIILEKK
jgi:glycosyltransferase involved in cell wall biosynthesis